MMSTKDAGEDLGFGRRPVDDVTAEIIATLEAGQSPTHHFRAGRGSRN